jgi:hypothetical protein
LRRRALYTDCAGFSVALLASLADDEGHALLPAGGARFWTEHSDRSGLDGWCATLGFGDSERGFLGRWAAKGSADIYVRTALRICENLQVTAVRYARASLEGGPDFFGEEEVLANYQSHLAGLGLEDEEVSAAAAKLQAPDFTLDPVVDGDLKKIARAPVPELGELADEDEDEDGNEDEADEGGEAAGVTPRAGAQGEEAEQAPDPELEAAVAAQDAERAAPPPKLEGFIVSRTRGGRHRSLHHYGSCWRIPGVHFKVYDIWGNLCPPEHEVDSKCRDCFGAAKELEAKAPEAEGEESATSSSSSSSVGKPPAKKNKSESTAAQAGGASGGTQAP